MGRPFTMDFGDGTSVQAELLEDKAPSICRKFAENLPAESFAVHAKFAGYEVIVMVPFFANAENEILDVQPGDIGYYPGRQTICIFYGDTTPFGKVSVFARLVDPPEKMKKPGNVIMENGWLPVKLGYTGS